MDTKNIKKFRFRFSVKIFVSHLLGIAVLLAFTNLAISYHRGEFELPFYDRNKNSNAQLEHDITPPDWDSLFASDEEATEDKTSVIDVINPNDLMQAAADADAPSDNYSATAPETTEPAHSFEFMSDETAKQGFQVTDGVYEAYDSAKINDINAKINNYKAEVNKILSEGGDSQVLPPEPLLYEYRFVKIEPEYKIPGSQRIATTGGAVKLAFEPVMDYMIVRSGEDEILCDASGKIITKDFATYGIEILKMRDGANRTVFKKDGAYFFYDPTGGESGKGAFVDVNRTDQGGLGFSEILGDRGVPFMYPSYYGADGANGFDRNYYSYNRKWGYTAAGTSNIVISRIYNMTYNFSEDLGIAYQDASGLGNKLFFFDQNGNNYLTTEHSYFAPDIVTAAHLGFFYFDNGLTRVYERVIDRRGFVIVERELIVNRYGTPFYIPEDYTIKAYSNGMILLEKGGFYGFMNWLGEWVAQPIYAYAQPFYEGVAVIGLENGKKALIDTKGNLLVKFRYDAITNCTGGIVGLFDKNEGWTILNKVRRQIPAN